MVFEEIVTLDLLDTDFKATSWSMLRELKETILQKLNHKFWNFYNVGNPSEFAHT